MEYFNVSTWAWPQFTYLALTLLGVGVVMAKHGTPKSGKNDAFGSIGATAIVFVILYYGRFWG